jgi:hypothetical protein
MICPNCNQYIRYGASVCAYCKAPLTLVSKEPGQETHQTIAEEGAASGQEQAIERRVGSIQSGLQLALQIGAGVMLIYLIVETMSFSSASTRYYLGPGGPGGLVIIPSAIVCIGLLAKQR